MRSEEDLTEHLGSGPTALSADTEACLLVLTGASAGQLFSLKKALTTLGRASDADVVLTDRGISRHHARLDRHANGDLKLIDLDSTNGTFVGGQPVTSTLLSEGDRVGLGPHATLLVVHRETVEELENRLQESEELQTESVGRLAAGVAHELNSPLGAICLAVEAAELHLGSRPDAAAKNLQNALEAAERAGEIVRKLLFYAGRTNSQVSDVDLNSLATQAAEKRSPSIRLETDGPIVIKGRHGELAEVIDNLILNALDAGSPETSITVSTRREGDWCVIAVKDQGEGIASEHLPLLFEPFFTTREVARKGLGLPVCQQVVSRHQGEIKIQSTLGEGSLFEVWLPG